MNKMNPLFVDSTKLHGDSIGTHVELKNVLVYDDENLCLVITNHQGVSIRVPMKAAEGRSYETRVHLNHQKSITYQFVIEKDGATFLQSATHRGRAQYAIIEEWEPTGVSIRQPVPPPVSAEPGLEQQWPGEYARSVKSLIEKWGL